MSSDESNNQVQSVCLAQQRSPARITKGILIGLVVALALMLVGVNVFMRIFFSKFYENVEVAVNIPGVQEGFVPQDIDYLASRSTWLYSGFNADGGKSAIYKRNSVGMESHFYVITPDGAVYDGHGSGITSFGEHVFLTSDTGYIVLDANDVARAFNGDSVKAIGSVDVGFAPAFLNVQNSTLYTGVFYNGNQYRTPPEMEIVTPNGTVNHAVMYAFGVDESTFSGFAEVPYAAYSIPDKVQGVCITPLGHFVFSTSWGIDASHLLVHNATLRSERSYYALGKQVPLFCFDETTLVDDISTPPMSEGIVMLNGKIYISYESASNKYIFGKLYGAGNVYKMDIAL